MEISASMDLSQLAEQMGSVATDSDARAMRDLLSESGYAHTTDVPQAEWSAMLDRAVAASDAAIYTLDWTSADGQSSMDMGQYGTIQDAIDAQQVALAGAMSQGFDDTGRWSVLDSNNTRVAWLRPENNQWSTI